MTPRILYQICVGEGGMSPEYYHGHLTYYEAQDFISGINRRYRASWQQSRLIADVQARCAGNKQGIKLEFPWEKESIQHHEYTQEEIQQMQTEGAAWAASLNAKRDS